MQLSRVRQVNGDVALEVDDVTRLVAVNVDSVLEGDWNLEAAAERQSATTCSLVGFDVLGRHHQVSLEDAIEIFSHQAIDDDSDVADDVAVREESPLCVCVAQPVTRLAVAQDPGGC